VFNIRKPFRNPEVRCVALVFWATWCAPCKEGIEKLRAAADRLKSAGVHVVLVNFGESESEVRSYFEGQDSGFPVVLDRFMNSQSTYIMSNKTGGALPRTVLLDRDSKVVAIFGAEGKDYVDRVVACGRPQ